jgi:Ca2+/H+ antiporter, TMEM165/GDT1 family
LGVDWKLFGTTFALIFIAEIGDKTQLATMSLAATGSRWVVFAAASVALVAAVAVAVLAGELLSRWISPAWLSRGAGALFIVLGILFVVSSFGGSDAGAAPSQDPPASDASAESS